MRGNLKALGLALLAILALGAVAAQGAWAVNHEFVTPGHEPTVLTAEADPQAPAQKIGLNGNVIECEGFHADGTQSQELATTVEMIPQIGGNCHTGEFPMTIRNEGNTKLNNDGSGTTGACKYVFHGETSANPSTTGVEDAPLDIKCEAGGAIATAIYGDEAHTELLCSIKFGQFHGTNEVNQGLHGVKYADVQTEGKAQEVTIEAKLHKVKYTSEGLFCFLLVPATGEATFEGDWTLRAFEDRGEGAGTGAQVSVEVNP